MIYKTAIKSKNPYSKKLILPLVILISSFFIGTIGFHIMWQDYNATFIDSIYMTYLIISTVGFRELYSLSPNGRLFTIIIGLVGTGSFLYIMTIVMENIVFMQVNNLRNNKKMRKTLENIQNHIIIVGYGRVGKLTVEHLINAGEDCVIVDDKIDTENLVLNHNKKLFVHGDATEDTVLKIAGIERAKGLIVTLANPADDVFVILTAKEINQKIYIVARADNEKDISKMMKAGADRIVNPYNAGGERMSNLMLNRNVVDFFKANLGEDLPELAFETIELPDDCPIIGKSLLEIDFRKKTKF